MLKYWVRSWRALGGGGRWGGPWVIKQMSHWPVSGTSGWYQ